MAEETSVVYGPSGGRPRFAADRQPRTPFWLAAAWSLAAAAAAVSALVSASPAPSELALGALMALVTYAYLSAAGVPLLLATWALLARRTPGFRHWPFAAALAAWLCPALALGGRAVGESPRATRLVFSLTPVACSLAVLGLVLSAGARQRQATESAGPPDAAT